MRKRFFVFLIFCSQILVNFHCKTKPASTISPSTSDEKMVEDILRLVNDYRRSKGLVTLTLNNTISAEAEKHSKRMASGRTALGHDGFSTRVQSISTQLGGPISRSAENVAFGSRTAKEVVTGWLNSTGHRENIEGQFNLTGIGVARNSKGQYYFTELFILK